MFSQASAPTGWTRITDDSAANRMLRVVSSGGGGTGGSADPILNNVVPAHTHSFTTGTVSSDHVHGGTTGTVSSDHAHAPRHWRLPLFGTGATTPTPGRDLGIPDSIVELSPSTGGINANHVHGFTTGGISANHTHSGSTDNGSSQTNWAPRYIDMILCSKN
jgi:hypothetical protein